MRELKWPRVPPEDVQLSLDFGGFEWQKESRHIPLLRAIGNVFPTMPDSDKRWIQCFLEGAYTFLIANDLYPSCPQALSGGTHPYTYIALGESTAIQIAAPSERYGIARTFYSQMYEDYRDSLVPNEEVSPKARGNSRALTSLEYMSHPDIDLIWMIPDGDTADVQWMQYLVDSGRGYADMVAGNRPYISREIPTNRDLTIHDCHLHEGNMTQILPVVYWGRNSTLRSEKRTGPLASVRGQSHLVIEPTKRGLMVSGEDIERIRTHLNTPDILFDMHDYCKAHNLGTDDFPLPHPSARLERALRAVRIKSLHNPAMEPLDESYWNKGAVDISDGIHWLIQEVGCGNNEEIDPKISLYLRELMVIRHAYGELFIPQTIGHPVYGGAFAELIETLWSIQHPDQERSCNLAEHLADLPVEDFMKELLGI